MFSRLVEDIMLGPIRSGLRGGGRHPNSGSLGVGTSGKVGICMEEVRLRLVGGVLEAMVEAVGGDWHVLVVLLL